MAWGKLTTKTADASTSFTTDVFGTNPFVQLLSNVVSASGQIQPRYRIGSTTVDTGSNYAWSESTNGAKPDTTSVSTSVLVNGLLADVNSLNVGYAINIATEEKLIMDFCVEAGAVGAGTAPDRKEFVGKWVNTSNQFDIVNISRNAGGPTFDTTYTNLSVLGSDLTPAAAIQFPTLSNVQAGSRAEITDTRKMYHKGDEYKVHKFTTTGQTFTVTGSGDIEYLVIAGGGGAAGGGGGAGGYLTATGYAVTAQNYAITVGSGGAG